MGSLTSMMVSLNGLPHQLVLYRNLDGCVHASADGVFTIFSCSRSIPSCSASELRADIGGLSSRFPPRCLTTSLLVSIDLITV